MLRAAGGGGPTLPKPPAQTILHNVHYAYASIRLVGGGDRLPYWAPSSHTVRAEINNKCRVPVKQSML